MAKLLDVNLAFALLHAAHEHAPRAKRWLDRQSEPDSLLLCRVTQMEVLRLLTRCAVMQEDLLRSDAAWDYWSKLLSDLRFRRVDEPPDLEAEWSRIAARLQTGACLDTDTYLAAFALSGGYALATFDQGFARFDGLRIETP